jgi:branched-chain amino acid aminotransferase
MICLNGSFIETKAVINRAMLFGDGFFESMRIQKNEILLEKFHLQRIKISCELLQLNCTERFLQELKSNIHQTITANQFNDHARVRVSIYRDGVGLYASSSNDLNYLITADELDSFYQFSDRGLSIGIFEEQVKSPGKYSCIKSLSSQLYVMASIYAQQHNLDEVVILNHHQNCIEGNTSNLFIIKNNCIYRPPISDGCVDGVFKNFLTVLLQKNNFDLKIQSVSQQDLVNADELFFCNAVRGIRWVNNLGDKTYHNSITKSIFDLLLRQF